MVTQKNWWKVQNPESWRANVVGLGVSMKAGETVGLKAGGCFSSAQWRSFSRPLLFCSTQTLRR